MQAFSRPNDNARNTRRPGGLHQTAGMNAPYSEKAARRVMPAAKPLAADADRARNFHDQPSEKIVNEQDELQALRAQIAKEQVGRIEEEFGRQNIAVQTVSGAGGVAYTYATDHILVREDAVQDVQAILRKVVMDPLPPEEVIPGVNLIRFGPQSPGQPAPAVQEVLEQIERGLNSQDAASYDHVVTVSGNPPELGACPATEPEQVYFDIEPFPGVRMEDDWSDGRGARIYIADTGLIAEPEWRSHSWLRGVKGAPDPLDPWPGRTIKPYAAHGTFVAGVAKCMAPAAHVYVSNVFKIAGSALESDLVQDLAAALDRGFDIFNLSITTPSRGDLVMLGFEAWRDLLRQHPGVVCVVAAGNDNRPEEFWPAAYPEMVSVGALAADWRSRASFSNHGDWVKVYAPGRELVNAYAIGTYECAETPYEGEIRRFYGMAKWSGTSFSTPLVAGLIAARKSRTGTTARQAADSLLIDARTQAIPHIGPILLPYGNKFQI
jgi:subtilisin family serine protease